MKDPRINAGLCSVCMEQDVLHHREPLVTYLRVGCDQIEVTTFHRSLSS